MDELQSIAGKVVVITGASSGLGEATARRLASEGATLVLGARRRERLDALKAELGGATLTLETDVTRRADVEALINTAVTEFGRVDVLLNNAGLMPNSMLETLRVEDWERMIDTNIKGVLYGIAAVLPHMIRQKSGHVINVASVAGHKVRPSSAVYSATKHAVRIISEGFRMEMTPHGIRSTIISPGAVATELVDSITDPAIAEATRRNVFGSAVSADSFARAVVYAITQPANLDINEILFRPVTQEY